MNEIDLIKQNLAVQNLPIYDSDLPFIQHFLNTANQTEAALNAFPYLNVEMPITIVDKELMLYGN